MTERADIVLFILASVLGLWGLSVFWRGVAGTRRRDRRCCRKCGGDPESTHTCRQCGFKPRHWKGLYARQRSAKVAAIGALAITLGGLSVWGGFVVFAWLNPYGDPPGLSPYGAMSVGVLLFALTLIITGWLGERAKGRKRCGKCWYDMDAVSGLQCPECGHEAARDQALFRPRRRRGRIAAGLIVLLIGLAGFRIEPTIEHGWRGAIPTTVLIAGFEWLPKTLIIERDPVTGLYREGSLENRSDSWEGLPEWQQDWLHRRAGALLESRSLSLNRIDRVTRFVGGGEGALGPIAGERAYRVLVSGVADDDSEVRAESVEGIWNFPWHLVRDWSADEFDHAHYAEGWVSALGDESEDVRITAASLLREVSPMPKEAVEWCFQIAESGPEPTASMTIGEFVIASYGLSAAVLRQKEVRGRVLSMARSTSVREARFALTSLRYMSMLSEDPGYAEVAGTEIYPAVIEQLRLRHPETAPRAASVLANLGVRQDESIRAMLDTAREDAALRESLHSWLGGFEESLRPYREELLPFLLDDDPELRACAARWCLFLYEPSDASSAAIADTLRRLFLDDPDESVRYEAHDVLIDLDINHEHATSDDRQIPYDWRE